MMSNPFFIKALSSLQSVDTPASLYVPIHERFSKAAPVNRLLFLERLTAVALCLILVVAIYDQYVSQNDSRIEFAQTLDIVPLTATESMAYTNHPVDSDALVNLMINDQ